eukprot:g7530.t1
MAADLDHRSPDVSQWGVGASVDGSGGGGGIFSTSSGAVGGTGGDSSGSSSGGSGRRGSARAGGGRCGQGVGVASPASYGSHSAGATAAAAAAAVSAAVPGGHQSVEHHHHQQQQAPGYLDHSRPQLEKQVQQQGQGAGSGNSGRRRRGQPGHSVDLDTMETESPEAPYGTAPAAAGASSGDGGRSGAIGGSADSAGAVAGPMVDGAVPSGMYEGGSGGGGGGGARARPASDRLAHKLSVSLIDTYKLINQRYYAEKTRQQEQSQESAASAAAAAGGAAAGTGGAGATGGAAGGPRKNPARQGGVYNHGMDDENFDYIVHEGEVFQGRYAVKETIGKGSFGKVYKAWDTQDNIYVALKVIKSKRPFTMQAKVEVNILELLRERDPEGKYNCARMLDQFMSHNHQCLVFEILSFNLYELLRSTQFQGVSLHLVRKFARHLLRALAFLSLPQVDVIHCDLKPENILLQHAKRSNIKVIDFGSSCRSNNKMYSYIQSRFYRSPEVMLGLPYTTAIDMWSLGCILVEMHTGEPLFAGVDQFDQMCRIVSVLGVTPSDVVERSPATHRGQFFEVDDRGSDNGMMDGMDGDSGGGGSGSDGGMGMEGDSAGEDQSPGLSQRTRGGSLNSPNAHRRRTRRKNLPRSGRGGGGRGRGGASSTEDDDDGGGGGGEAGEDREDSDHDMADFSPNDPGPGTPPSAASGTRYRLRENLLLKRARSGAAGGGGSAAAGVDARGGYPDVPRVPLSEVVGVYTGGPSGRREGEAGHDQHTYGLFVDLVLRMLDQRPETRITPAEALLHPFLVDHPPPHTPIPPAAAADAVADGEGGASSSRPAGVDEQDGEPGARLSGGVHGNNVDDDDDDDKSMSGACASGPAVVGDGRSGGRSGGDGGTVLSTPDGMQSQLSSAVAAAAAAASATASSSGGKSAAASSGTGDISRLFFSRGQHDDADDERGGGGSGGGGRNVARGGFGNAPVDGGGFNESVGHGYPAPAVEGYGGAGGGEDGSGSGGGEEAFGGSGGSPSPQLRPRSEPGRPGTAAAAAAAGGCSEPRHRRCRHHQAPSSGEGGGGSSSRTSPNDVDSGTRRSRGDVGGKGGGRAGRGAKNNSKEGRGAGAGVGVGSWGSKAQSAGLRRGRSRGLPGGGGAVDGVGVGAGAGGPAYGGSSAGKRPGLRRRDDAMMMEDDAPLSPASSPASGLPGAARGGGAAGVGSGLSVETRRGKALREGGGGSGAAGGHAEAASRPLTSSDFSCEKYTRVSIRTDMVLKSSVGKVSFNNFALKVYGSLTVEPDVSFTGVTLVRRRG